MPKSNLRDLLALDSAIAEVKGERTNLSLEQLQAIIDHLESNGVYLAREL
jgi:hypothetical protein